MSLKLKLFISMALILGASLACIIYGVTGSGNISSSVTTVKDITYPALDGAITLSLTVEKTRQAVLAAIDETDEELLLEIDELSAHFDKTADEIMALSPQPELQKIIADYKEYRLLGSDIVRRYLRSLDIAEVQDDIPKISMMASNLNLGIEEFRTNRYKSFNQALDSINLKTGSFKSLFISMGAVLIFIVLVVIAVLNDMMGRIKSLVEVAEQLSTGNLEIPITQTSKDEIGVLTNSFDNMRGNLKDLIDNLDAKVKERTYELSVSQKGIQDILDSIDQGIFTFNEDLSLNAEHSIRAEKIFAVQDFTRQELGSLFAINPDQIEDLQSWVLLVMRNPRAIAQWDTFSRLSPVQEIVLDHHDQHRIIKIEYKPIIEDQIISRIQVLATDETEQREAELALRKIKREQSALTSRVISLVECDIDEMNGFLNEALRNIAHFRYPSDLTDLADGVHTLFRKMHTLKGLSGTLGFEELALRLGSAENLLDNLRKKTDIDMAEWTHALTSINHELNEIVTLKHQLFQGTTSDRISINSQQYEDLLVRIKSNESLHTDEIYRLLHGLNAKPLSGYCAKYRKLIKRFGENANKDIDDLKIVNATAMIHRDLMAQVDPALVHMFRNAIDHGIESDEDRESADKGIGTITLRYEQTSQMHIFSLHDDGAGIDVETIADKAVARSLVTVEEVNRMSEVEKLELIYLSGLTTKSDVTDTSGRGVGMDAVKTIIEALGGRIVCDTKPGEGTTFTLQLPYEEDEARLQ